MAALAAEYQEMLRRELKAQYVSHLPPLLPNNSTPEQQAEKQVSRALSAFAIHSVLGTSAKVASQSVVDDFHDNGIDAIYYDAKTETLHLFQSRLKATQEFQQDEAQAFCAGVRLLINQEFASFNANVQTRQTDIANALETASHIQLWIVYTGTRVSDAAKAALKHLIEDDSHGEQERMCHDICYVDPVKIAEELRRRQSYKPVNTEVILLHDVKVEEPRITWYGMVEVQNLVTLHKEFGKALYEKNVRYFLGSAKSDVNKGIKNTLATDPKAFFFLNNGVTALCTDVAAKDRKAGTRRLKVQGLSIINGAQTVASAAELMSQPNPPDIGDARVMFTLIRANADGQFGSRITRARNSQNPVATANFASQDPTQERLRQELGSLGITYHYRPEAAAIPSATSILLEEAIHALSWLLPDPRYPVWLKSGKGDVDDVDSPAYKAIFADTLHGTHVANAVFFSRAVKLLLKIADVSTSGQERLLYRHGMHAIGSTYLKRLKSRIFVSVPVNPDAIPGIVSQSFDAHRQFAANRFLSTPTDKGPLAFFKSQAYTTPYLARLMEDAYGLQQHPALPALNVPQLGENYSKQNLMVFLTNHAAQV